MESEATLREQTVYRVEVRGPADHIFAFVPDLPHACIYAGKGDFRSLFLGLQHTVGDAAFLHPESDPVEWRRRHPGTHWYVRGDERQVEIVREEWVTHNWRALREE